MESLAQTIKRIVQTNDCHAAGRVADYMRFSLGLDYKGMMRWVKKACPDIADADRQWEALLEESDHA